MNTSVYDHLLMRHDRDSIAQPRILTPRGFHVSDWVQDTLISTFVTNLYMTLLAFQFLGTLV